MELLKLIALGFVLIIGIALICLAIASPAILIIWLILQAF